MRVKESTQAVVADRWDRENLQGTLKAVSQLRAARNRLGKFCPTGKEAMNDTFWALSKALPTLRDPSEVAPTFRVNRAIMEALAGLPDTERLRRFTVGDDVQAALACVTIEPDLETLFDRFVEETKQAKRLEDAVHRAAQARVERETAERDLDEMLARWVNDDGELGPLGDERSDELDGAARDLMVAEVAVGELEKEAGELSAELDASIAGRMATLTVMVRDALSRAQGKAAAFTTAAAAWGVGPGELQRLSAKERVELARRLDTDRMRAISKIFGRIEMMAMSDYLRPTSSPHEILDFEFGNDLGRLARSELLNFCEPALEDEFLRRYSERALLQYSMEGEEPLGRGGIVFCEDGSASMAGERELWAKAVMLKLLNIAREQGREMHVLHFGSPGQIRILSFVKPEDFTFDGIVEAAELFWASGTDFVTPMSHALDILRAEHEATGFVRADVVFVTDDECVVPDEFMERYLRETRCMQTTTWGIATKGRRPAPGGALHRMSEGKVALVKDFASGIDVRDVFRSAA